MTKSQLLLVLHLHPASINQSIRCPLINELHTGTDAGFFLGGDAPVKNGVTKFFFAEYQLYLKAAGHLGGGGVHTSCTLPLDPPLVQVYELSGVNESISWSAVFRYILRI